MKKHISAAFAVLALAACSKMAPENETVISELPEGENQQETVEPKGEGIVFQLPETKVILNGDTYQFEGTEEIVVKARSSADAVTVMTNTTTEPNIFKGVFKTSLGRESETFDFYFNCANKTTAEKELVQNGQPWLECTGVTAKRVADDSEANYIIDESKKIELRELPNSITLALVSTYNCTVDFHSLSAKIPAATQDKTIAGMSVTAGKPYFVNINTDTDGEFKGGFYLAVNKTGETGTMYTSYATAKPISKNTPIQIKTDFTPLSGTVSFDGFKTTYDIAKTDLATANSKNSNFMTSGTITVTLSGISSKLDFVESVTFFDGDTEFTLKDKSKSGNTYTFNVGESYTHNDFGPRTLTAKVNFKSPVSSSTNINGETIRHITGLPYNACPTKDTWEYSNIADWNIDKNLYGGGLMYDSNGYIKKSFYIPQGVINASVSHSGYARKGSATSKTTTFIINVGSTELCRITSKTTTSPGEKTNVSYDIQFTKNENYIKCTSTLKYLKSTYATTNNIKIQYR
ncbi:MAG: lipoprotein [Rikenellaceae bacterium]|nr:lipoprotein [Rikenellaceae bacterium]